MTEKPSIWEEYRNNVVETTSTAVEATIAGIVMMLVMIGFFLPMVSVASLTNIGVIPDTLQVLALMAFAQGVWIIVVAIPVAKLVLEDDQ